MEVRYLPIPIVLNVWILRAYQWTLIRLALCSGIVHFL